MEPFVDFGLFEIVVALGLSAIASRVYAHRLLRVVFPIVSLAAPVVLLFLAPTESLRWIAALVLATTLVNLSLVVAVLQTGEIPRLTFPTRHQHSAPRAATPGHPARVPNPDDAGTK